MKQLIEKQKKEFEKKYNTSVLIAYPEYAESHMILLTDIWNWHKQSLKQFIDELIEEANVRVATLEELKAKFNLEIDKHRIDEVERYISYLKKLKEELN